jgi:uncharacterized tellurite resistance protein B-like protein
MNKMANILQNLFPAYFSENISSKAPTAEQKLYVAACALFFEMANIDGEFSSEEKQRIGEIFTSEYGLDKQHFEQITQMAEQELKNSPDLWRFTNVINQELSSAEKIKLVELIWKIIYADGKLDRHEDYLIHKFARLLNVPHSDLINAKLKILHD